MLSRLGLQLARVPDVRHQRQVDEHAAAAADVDRELADRLEERKRLDVADRAADLGDDEVDLARVGHQLDPLLDLVGDVRDHLDGRAEVVAPALAADDGVVDPAGGDVRGPARVGVGEALVVAEIEVGLGAVLGHEHLAVLIRRHRARVDVDVRVELLQLYVEPPRDEQPTDRGCGDALAERGDHSARDEDKPRFAVSHRRTSSLTGVPTEAETPAQAARSSSRACSEAAPSSLPAPSIRTSSPTTPSPSSIVTVVVAGSVPACLTIAKWRCASAATCGRWGMQRIWRRSDRPRRCSPTARAVWPPMPASISSNTSSGATSRAAAGSLSATLISASMIRDSSPPDATSRNGASAPPALAAICISIESAPRGPQPSGRGPSSISNRASGIDSSASRSRTAAASPGAAARRASPSSPASSSSSPRAPASSCSADSSAWSACSSSSRRARHRSACASTSSISPPCLRCRRGETPPRAPPTSPPPPRGAPPRTT